MLTSLFFVVAGFIEFAFVLQLHQYNEKQQKKQETVSKWKSYKNGTLTTNINELNQIENGGINIIDPVYNVRKLDIVAFSVVGAMFLLFNIIYWVVFLAFDFTE